MTKLFTATMAGMMGAALSASPALAKGKKAAKDESKMEKHACNENGCKGMKDKNACKGEHKDANSCKGEKKEGNGCKSATDPNGCAEDKKTDKK